MGALVWLLAISLAANGLAAQNAASVAFREAFETLEHWQPLTFPKIGRHTRYSIEKDGENSVLRADAQASASAIVYKATFDVRQFPNISWRWKIDHVLTGGDAKTKAGDDYPIRIYIIFPYDPQNASFGQRLQYAAAKALYGKYPPDSSLNYIWANRRHPELVLVNPYTDKARMLLLEKGGAKAGTWVSETRNILKDYRLAFGRQPPPKATVAIMADTDNTGQRSTAWVDDLVVYR